MPQSGTEAIHLAGLLAEQRAAFDQAFAAPPPAPRVETTAMLAIRVGGERYALPLDQVSALRRRERIVPLPGCAPWVLGMVGVRGRVAAAYSLAQLLGRGEHDAERWLALHGHDQPEAFAFAGFDGLHAGPEHANPGAVIALGEHHYTVLDLPALATAARAGAAPISSADTGAQP